MWLIFRSSPPKQDARNIVFFYSKNFHLKSCLPTDKNFNIISCNIIHMCLKRNWKNYIAVQSALSIKNIHRQLGFLTALYFFQAVRKPLVPGYLKTKPDKFPSLVRFNLDNILILNS